MAWSGVFPAVTTKMTIDGAIDVEATQQSIERLIAEGVEGVIVLPMLGENASLSLPERERIIRAGKEVVAGRVALLSGLAETTLDGARANAKAYVGWGAEGLMVFPSLGYRTDKRETAAWYRGVAGAARAPIMIYNNPIAYGVDVTPEVLQELADVEELVCVKKETGDIRRITDTFITCGDRYSIFCGVDDMIVESVALGATGWVSGMVNAMPKACVRLFELCVKGQFEAARPLYRILTPAFHLDTHVKLVQYIKLAEQIACGAPEWTRAPRLALVGEERARVEETVRDVLRRLSAHGL
jgi:4-hydroxy-tetrahydrodipicolinate synthase